MSVSEVAISTKHMSAETPMVVSRLVDRCLYTGMFGSLDSNRMASISDKLTNACVENEVDFVILDLANVDAIDTAVSVHLFRLATTLQTIGVAAIFCGITPVMARTMAASGVDVRGYECTRDLQSALTSVLAKIGKKIVDIG